jgi:hypothetical protein
VYEGIKKGDYKKAALGATILGLQVLTTLHDRKSKILLGSNVITDMGYKFIYFSSFYALNRNILMSSLGYDYQGNLLDDETAKKSSKNNNGKKKTLADIKLNEAEKAEVAKIKDEYRKHTGVWPEDQEVNLEENKPK